MLTHKYTDVYSTSIHNSPKLETTQLSFSGRMVKLTEVRPCHGILLSNKMAQTIDSCHDPDESPDNHEEWEK